LNDWNKNNNNGDVVHKGTYDDGNHEQQHQRIPPRPRVTVSRSVSPQSKTPVRTIPCPIANKANTANTAIKAIKASLENPCKIRVDVNQATPFLLMTGKI
jgi:hypothetical protein